MNEQNRDEERQASQQIGGELPVENLQESFSRLEMLHQGDVIKSLSGLEQLISTSNDAHVTMVGPEVDVETSVSGLENIVSPPPDIPAQSSSGESSGCSENQSGNQDNGGED